MPHDGASQIRDRVTRRSTRTMIHTFVGTDSVLTASDSNQPREVTPMWYLQLSPLPPMLRPLVRVVLPTFPSLPRLAPRTQR